MINLASSNITKSDEHSENHFENELTLKVFFNSEKQASISCTTLSVDPILKENEIKIVFSVENKTLICNFKSNINKLLRSMVNNTINNIKSIIECMEEFDSNE